MSETDVVFEGGEPNPFQLECAKRVVEVLSSHGVRNPLFYYQQGAKEAFWTKFVFDGKEHILAIYADEVNMMQDKALFEPYLHAEFTSDKALIEGFAGRLDRYLSGGAWEGSDEGTFLDATKAAFVGLCHRLTCRKSR